MYRYRLVLSHRKCYTTAIRVHSVEYREKGAMDEEKRDHTGLSRDTAWLLRNIGSAMREALNGSMAASELLGRRLEKSELADEREYLAILRHDQHRLLHIAENLTELGNLSLGDAERENSVQDLNAICGEIVETVSAMVRRVSFSFAPCRDTCFVSGSRNRLEALVLNVLAYSLHRCEDGDTITLRTERPEDEVRLFIEDNSRGMEGESIATLYSALEQDPLHGATQGGAGLDLLVAEGIAGLHGGSLLLSAKQDSGMEAVLTLPRCRTSILRVRGAEYGGRLRGILTILADELSRDKYMAPYL